MKINAIQNYSVSNKNYSKTHSTINSLSPLKEDTVSFSGKNILLNGTLNQVNDNNFPDDLYLDLDKVYETFEKQEFYHRWENFPLMLADLLAKRCNYLELTENATGIGYGSSPFESCGFQRTETISISECCSDKQENIKSIKFDWTRECNELEEFFKGGEDSIGAENSMEEIKAGLPEILRKQGWIK